MKKEFINFSLGPVMIDKDILKIGSYNIPYFRTEEFSHTIKENEKLILKALNAPHNSRAIFLTGSGTSAMEASVINIFSPRDKVLVINGGTFGERFACICKIYNIDYTEIKLQRGKQITKQDLLPFENKGYTGMLVNICETSTGVLYDKKLIADFCKRNHLKLVVDAISTFLADTFDMKKIGACAVIVSSQKALALPPGLSIIALTREAVSIIRDNKKLGYIKTLYFDLENALLDANRGQTPFTPAVSILLQLNKRLKMLDKEGFTKIIKRTSSIAIDFRDRIKNFPFKIPYEFLSNALTPLSPIDKTISAYDIVELIRKRYNIFLCPSGGESRDTLIRVGHIGALTKQDNTILLNSFNELKSFGLLGDNK